MRRQVFNVGSPEGLPISDAVRFGDFLFVSGIVGMDQKGRIVPGGIKAETEQAFRNIEAILNLQGCTLDDILKVNVVLTDRADFDAFNAACRRIFPQDPPARVSMVAALTIDARLEVDVIAGCPTAA